ncbi:MAG: hypothetical protein JWM80_1492 [Cyanobacteria bacterium RYN_339]|nr:hypothetical protein [Cyanobacteria bacterium RYN_339]
MLLSPGLASRGGVLWDAVALAARFGVGLVFVLGLTDALVAAARTDIFAPKFQVAFHGANPCSRVILGTSHVFHGVDPHALELPGQALYNFGFNGSNPSYFLAFYTDLCRFYARPSLVLLGLDPLFLKRFAWSRRYVQDSEYWPGPLFLQRATRVDADAGTAWLNRFPLVKHRDPLQDATACVPARSRFLVEKAYRGYVPMAPQGTPILEGTDFPDDPGFTADLPVLLGRLKADGARVVLFQTPEFLAVTGDHHADNAKLAAVARRFELPFLNYNAERRSELNREARLFNDGGHLNVLGSERFSRRLAADLRAGHFL